jgi:uncharacterized membrane protein
MNRTKYIAYVGMLSSLWVVLQLTLGPMGFTLFGLPIFCDVSAYFPLLLAVWFFRKFGGASSVGLIGSLVVLFFRPNAFQVLGFAASSVIFDLLAFVVKHEVKFEPKNVIIVSLITVLSAYVAGLLIGLAIMGGTIQWTLTIWGPLHLIGGILSLITSYPVLIALNRIGIREHSQQ